MALGKISSVTAAALVCAGLLSVLIFPPIALALLRQDELDPAPGVDAAHTRTSSDVNGQPSAAPPSRSMADKP